MRKPEGSYNDHPPGVCVYQALDIVAIWLLIKIVSSGLSYAFTVLLTVTSDRTQQLAVPLPEARQLVPRPRALRSLR